MEKKKNDDFFETIEWLVFENYYEKPNLLKEIDLKTMIITMENLFMKWLSTLLKNIQLMILKQKI